MRLQWFDAQTLLPLITAIIVLLHGCCSTHRVLAKNDDHHNDSSDDDSYYCGLYFAPSVAIGSNGWGVYAGRNYKEGEQVGDAGIAILVDIVNAQQDHELSWLWSRTTITFSESNNNDDVQQKVYLPGQLASLANHHAIFHNVGATSHYTDDDDGRRTSPHAKVTFFATKDIKMDQEIFLGEISLELMMTVNNNNKKEDHSTFLVVPPPHQYPTKQDYKRARDILDRLYNDLYKPTSVVGFSQLQWMDLLNRMRNEWMITAVGSNNNNPPNNDNNDESSSTLMHLLPRTQSDVIQWHRLGIEKVGVRRRRHKQESFCLDTIRVEVVSRNEHANTTTDTTTSATNKTKRTRKGAVIATQQIPPGQIIVPVPLRPVRASYLEASPTMINYCLGHETSDDLLLCPLTNHVALLNHDAMKPNAILQWDLQQHDEETRDWLLRPANEVLLAAAANHNLNFLWMQLIAIDMIEEGDEIVMDYGPDWQAAWDQYRHSKPGASEKDDSYFRHFIPLRTNMWPPRWHKGQSSTGAPISNLDEPINSFKTDKVRTKPAVVKRVDQDRHEAMLREVPCGLYRAPSSLMGMGKSSLYTAVPYLSEGLSMATGVLPVVLLLSQDTKPYSPFLPHQAEHDMIGMVEGGLLAFGLQSNSQFNNVEASASVLSWRPLLDRCNGDPGAGAFSDYEMMAYSFQSIRSSLEAGTELFASYPKEYFITIRDDTIAATTSQQINFDSTATLVSSLHSFVSTLEDTKKKPRDKIVERLVGFVRKTLLRNNSDAWKVLKGIKSLRDLKRLRKATETSWSQSGEPPRATIEWLQQNGQCMDHIYIKESTIRQAGRGAFARRPLQQGDTVLSSPLVSTFVRRDTTFRIENASSLDIQPMQLIVNYHLAHNESSLLLLPTNQLLAVNHASNRSDSPIKPNVKLEWARWDNQTQYLLQRQVGELKRGELILDVVATRDIEADEEIFMDYGQEWEEAWSDHVDNFPPSCDGDSVASSVKSSKEIASLNLNKFQDKGNYEWSEHHFVVCQYDQGRLEKTISFIDLELDSSGSKRTYQGLTVESEGFNLVVYGSVWYPCKILGAHVSNHTFDALLYSRSGTSDTTVVHHLLGISESAMEFRSKPFKSDMYWKGAFRHEIGIPDSIFPHHWRDLDLDERRG